MLYIGIAATGLPDNTENMNNYEQKQEARRERLEARARKVQAEADARYKRGTEALHAIPFGQPILVGHHSERGDRAYRARAVGNIDKSFMLEKKAEYYTERAEAVGTGGISSDDPDALDKLRDKLARLQLAHEMVKSKNHEARAKGEPKPYAPYVLSNSNANINSVKKRIEELEARESMEVRADIVREGLVVREDKEENRIMFLFDRKPDESTRSALKRYGFKWSPTRLAWVRQLNSAGRYAVNNVLRELDKVQESKLTECLTTHGITCFCGK